MQSDCSVTVEAASKQAARPFDNSPVKEGEATTPETRYIYYIVLKGPTIAQDLTFFFPVSCRNFSECTHFVCTHFLEKKTVCKARFSRIVTSNGTAAALTTSSARLHASGWRARNKSPNYYRPTMQAVNAGNWYPAKKKKKCRNWRRTECMDTLSLVLRCWRTGTRGRSREPRDTFVFFFFSGRPTARAID